MRAWVGSCTFFHDENLAFPVSPLAHQWFTYLRFSSPPFVIHPFYLAGWIYRMLGAVYAEDSTIPVDNASWSSST